MTNSFSVLVMGWPVGSSGGWCATTQWGPLTSAGSAAITLPLWSRSSFGASTQSKFMK
jgi:hypothetical protein